MSEGRLSLSAIERGVVFVYYGPRRGILRRRGIASGVVVGVDQAIGVVHVQTMRPRGEDVIADVGHIPILWAAFERSVHTFGEKAPHVADQASPEVDQWRERHARGEVGAFSCALWEAENMAWETLPAEEKERGREGLYIAYAYPKRDEHGKYATVEVGVHRH